MKYNICIIGVPEGEDRDQGIENLFEEIMTENIPNLLKEKEHKSKKCRVPNKMNQKRSTSRHLTIKVAKVKDKEGILKEQRKRQLPTRKLP